MKARDKRDERGQSFRCHRKTGDIQSYQFEYSNAPSRPINWCQYTYVHGSGHCASEYYAHRDTLGTNTVPSSSSIRYRTQLSKWARVVRAIDTLYYVYWSPARTPVTRNTCFVAYAFVYRAWAPRISSTYRSATLILSRFPNGNRTHSTENYRFWPIRTKHLKYRQIS